MPACHEERLLPDPASALRLCGMTLWLWLEQIFVEIPPVGILRFDQRVLPRASPAFDFLLTLHCTGEFWMLFNPDETVDPVAGGVAW